MIVNILLGLMGAIIGLTFADVDLWPTLPLKHRSAWTHGPLIPWLLPWLVDQHPAMWPFVTGFLITYCFHLVADMFPTSWHGSAMINLHPFKLSLPPVLSFLWLAVGVVFTLYTWLEMVNVDVWGVVR